MDDARIVDLYWARAEAAVTETADKYGRYCHAIAYHILRNPEDSEECVTDTWMRAWDCMPPNRPNDLKAFLGTITRNLSLKRYRTAHAGKRGSGQADLALEELRECLPARDDTEHIADDLVLIDVLNRFLGSLPAERRKIFVRRYWYLHSVKEIAAAFSMGESRVKMCLLRGRETLRKMLEQEGIVI